MSEFDEARLAAAAWVRAQMDRYGLSLDDLVAAGCFSGARPDRDAAGVPAPTDATASAPKADAEPARQQQLALSHPAQPPQPGGVLYRNALGQIWDGTGEMPDWLQRAVNAGQTPEFYRVN